MKKQLAILLAGSMALSTVPTVTTFAASSSIGKGLIVSNPSADTVYIGSNLTVTPGPLPMPVGNVSKVASSSIIKFGSDAYIQEGSMITIKLTNARWATDAELTAVNTGNVTTLLDEIHAAGAGFTDSVTTGLDIRRLSDDTILLVGTSAILADTVKNIAVPADFVPTGTGTITAQVINSNLPGISTNAIELSRSVTNNTGITATITPATQLSQVRTSGAAVTLTENIQGQFKPNSTYSITLPTGYYFDNVAPSQFTTINTNAFLQAKAGTDWQVTGNVIEYSQPASNKIDIHFSSDYAPNYTVSSLGSVLSLSGLVINNSSGSFNNDVYATVYGNGISQSGKIAYFGSFGLKAEVIGTPTTIPSGTNAQNYVLFGNMATAPTATTTVKDYTVTSNSDSLTNTLRITENIPASFRGGDVTVTFPEGVTVTGLDVLGASANTLLSGIDPSNDTVAKDVIAAPGGYTTITSPTYTGLEANQGQAYKYITFSDNKVTFRGLSSSSDTAVIDLKVQFELSASNDFSGDVVGVLTSSNTTDVATPVQTGVLATFEDVIDVETTVSDLQVGLSSQRAGDVTITENKPYTFKSGETFTLKLDDKYASAGYGISSAKVDVTGGNLAVSDVTINNRNTSNSSISFRVNGITTGTELGQILVSDVYVYSDRSVPTYVEGNAVKLNISSTESLQVPIVEDYIRFNAETTNNNNNNNVVENQLNENVILYMGRDVAYVGDTTVNLLGTPYISADGNAMVPVKGIGYALGIAESNVIYDPVEKSATFVLPNGKMAQIRDGASYAVINGMKLPLIDAGGQLVSPVIRDGRFYLPLRATCNTVFGVEVTWLQDSNAVIVNSNGTTPTLPTF